MLGKPIDATDVTMVAVLATAVVVIVIGMCAQIWKPSPNSTASPETIARFTRNTRISMTLSGCAVGTGALSSLMLHRVPAWLSIAMMGANLLVAAALWFQVIRRLRQRAATS